MRLLYSAIFRTGSEGPTILSSAAELSSFGYFQRSSVKEMMVFFSRTFAKSNSAPGQRTAVKHEGYLCHLYTSPSGVTGVCFADAEYPSRVCFGYLSKLCEDFVQVTGGRFSSDTTDGCMDAAFGTQHQRLITQFQDPSQADQLTKIMNELEQTKVVRCDPPGCHGVDARTPASRLTCTIVIPPSCCAGAARNDRGGA